ncbi:DUF6300 family protein [Cryptosporangium arvum]|uniref:DUF6300 family protein n=1 Tax=Cryptosporangium arvum TaxID=80871 RepID=UPI0004B5D58E|nr:DUF6300 family protein [Cryptosporangium arvum]
MVSCPRCGGPALLAVEVAPASSAVLCAACDLDHPSGGAVVLWFAVHGRINTPAQMDELAGLLRPWVEDVSPPSVDSTALQATVDAWAAKTAAPAATGAGLMCDFCEAAVPRWAYRADETAASVPAGDWFACDGCRPYVDARAWTGLADMVGDDRTESWVAFEGAAPRAARPWPPRPQIYRWP